MGLRDHLRLLRRRWWIVLFAVLAGGAGAYYATWSATHLYESNFSMYLAGPSGDPDNSVAADVASNRVATFAKLADSPRMMQQAIDSVGGSTPPGHVTVLLAPTDSPIIFTVSVTADSAQGTYALARAYANLFPDFVARFEGVHLGRASSPVRVLEQPTYAGAPISPNPERNILIGLTLGLVLGIAGMFMVNMNDRKLRTADQADDATEFAVLASIPHEEVGGGALAVSRPGSVRAEATRQLRTNIRFAGVARPLHSLVITSPGGRDGKTTTAVDLALAFGRAGQRVLLVDADLRHPSIADQLRLYPSPGLSDVLIDEVLLNDVLQTPAGEDHLSVLTSGPIPANPSELLDSARMRALVAYLATRYDMVIFDSPPVLPVTDAVVLAQMAGGVLLVARTGHTRVDQLRRAASTLAHLDLRVLGVVCQDVRAAGDTVYIRRTRRARKAASVHAAKRAAGA